MPPSWNCWKRGDNVTNPLRPGVQLLLCLLAYFSSGAASLCAEVTWNRMLIVVVGNSLAATSMIVVVFMGGLGLGGYAGGKLLARRRCSLLPYAILEVLIAAYILLSPILFDLLAGAFSSLAEQWEQPALLSLLRFAVTVVALLIPATLMGATFPAIMTGVRSRYPGNSYALLYGVNTVGAAVGCFVGGYHLLFELGVQATLWLAAGLGGVSVICVAVAAVLSPSRACFQLAPEPEAADEGSSASGEGGLFRFLAVSSFLVGFVALAYEVLATRMVILFLNNLASTFALALTGFLLGTGAGALLANGAHAANNRIGGNGVRLFGAIALLSGILLAATPYVIMAASYPLQALGIIVIPMVFLGSLLPFAIRTLHAKDREVAIRGTSFLYAANTVGGMLGAGLINYQLLPRIGLQGSVGLLFGICAAIAVACFVPSLTRGFRWATLLLVPALMPLITLNALPNIMNRYALKIAEWTGAPEVTIRLIHEGRAANVTVLDQKDPKQGEFRDMYLNGIEEASTRFYHAQLFKLLGMLPAAVHGAEGPKNALVIAFGSGITAGSVLASDMISSLDVVDLNPDVEGINNLFKEFNGDVFHEPRFRFHNDDGRNYLVTSGKKYDLIISDSTHPCSYDSWILYTREFYRDVKRRLPRGGVFAQWVSVSEIMRGELFPIYLNTFRSVFPHATFWYVYGSNQALMLATPEPFRLDADKLQKRLDRLAPWFRAGEYQLDSVAKVAGFFWLDEEMMGRMIGAETRVNTDMRHYFEKSSMQAKIPPQRQLPFYQADVTRYLTGGDERLRSDIRKEQKTGWLLTRYGFYGDMRDLNQAYCLSPENNNVKYWMRFAYSGNIPAGVCP
ncbi:spermine synthase [Geobacter pickeringii]|uniref:Spermine synthase n=1 Tax=Geobacter pickeringii TaxID=345632 RepID=A0A0B5BEK3_9BACT|nr:spermine synthase [Geobacter pickeringii]